MMARFCKSSETQTHFRWTDAYKCVGVRAIYHGALCVCSSSSSFAGKWHLACMSVFKLFICYSLNSDWIFAEIRLFFMLWKCGWNTWHTHTLTNLVWFYPLIMRTQKGTKNMLWKIWFVFFWLMILIYATKKEWMLIEYARATIFWVAHGADTHFEACPFYNHRISSPPFPKTAAWNSL